MKQYWRVFFVFHTFISHASVSLGIRTEIRMGISLNLHHPKISKPAPRLPSPQPPHPTFRIRLHKDCTRAAQEHPKQSSPTAQEHPKQYITSVLGKRLWGTHLFPCFDHPNQTHTNEKHLDGGDHGNAPIHCSTSSDRLNFNTT